MQVKLIEASNGGNWGKFAVCRWDAAEWAIASSLPDASGGSLLRRIGTSPEAVWVLDLQTREGASFQPGGLASADLEKHRVWVCPMFHPFLEWLYAQDLTDLAALPAYVDLPDAPFAFAGYRRAGAETPMYRDGAVQDEVSEMCSRG